MDIERREPGETWTPENGLHFTLIFHTFVFMQVFNEINCRKIGESEFNVFADFFDNALFIFIMVVTVCVQIILVQYGGEAVKCTPLTLEQHGICICVGAVSIIVSFIVKLLPLSLFSCFQVNEEPMSAE